jgi:hypothetical protein
MADLPQKKSCISPWRILLAVPLLAALCVVGYQRGYRRGYDVPPPPANAGQLYIVTYPVGDLVQPNGIATSIQPVDAAASPKRVSAVTGTPSGADFDSLIDLIVVTVERDSWMESGTGQGEIQPFPSNQSLVISQTQRVHQQIANLLEQLRQAQQSVRTGEFVPFIQSCAALDQENEMVVRRLSADAQGRAANVPQYERSVRNLVDLWGAPEYQGAQESPGFPAWSADQRVAWWRRAGGIAYVAIRDDRGGTPQIMAGWRRAE